MCDVLSFKFYAIGLIRLRIRYSISVLVMLNGRLHARSAAPASHMSTGIIFYHSNNSTDLDAESVFHTSTGTAEDDVTASSICNDNERV